MRIREKKYFCGMKKTRLLTYLLAQVFLLLACDYNPYIQGEQLYLKQCAHCHMDDGSGLERVIPALRESRLLREAGADLACLVRKGTQDSLLIDGQWLYGDMPPNDKLNATEITNLLNFLRHTWGKGAKALHVHEIEESLKRCDQ